jgi:hypothetical protein
VANRIFWYTNILLMRNITILSSLSLWKAT